MFVQLFPASPADPLGVRRRPEMVHLGQRLRATQLVNASLLFQWTARLLIRRSASPCRKTHLMTGMAGSCESTVTFPAAGSASSAFCF